ncbi:MAG: DMT family transporter [Betaproteobacteria bacterium]|nr:DMT family transporter [Betaproteobacteria bacterium]
MVIAPVLWSLGGVLTRQVESPRPLELAFWRSLFCALFVAAVLLAFKAGNPLVAIRKAGVAGLISGAMWGLMFTSFIVALTLTTVANVLVVCSLGPLFTALLAFAVLREPIPPRTWLAIVVAALGMAAMFGAGFTAAEPRHIFGTLLALSIPVAAAINVVVLRKAGAHLDLVPAVLLGALLSVAASLPWALPLAAGARDLGVLAVLGVFQIGLPCMLLVLAARTLSAPEIALLGLLEVVLGPLWAWLGAGEVPGAATVAGGALVLAALAGNELALLAGRARDGIK